MKRESVEAYLQLYSFILSWSLARNRELLDRVTFCDYGAEGVPMLPKSWASAR
jgi:hypothetical protein